jgi:hypothetical protein
MSACSRSLADFTGAWFTALWAVSHNIAYRILFGPPL